MVWDGSGLAPMPLRMLMQRGVGVASVAGPRLNARFAGRAGAALKLLSVERGSTELSTPRGVQRLAAGDLALLDPACPAALRSDGEFEHLVAVVPRFAATAPAVPLGQAWQAGGPDEPLLGLLRGWRLASAGMSSASQHAAGAALAQLLHDRMAAPPVAPGDWIGRRARALVGLELVTITPDTLARQLRLSRRRLDQLLGGQGLTASRLIWACRMERAASLLRLDARDSITTIAHRCGFKDSSHFSRLFRQAHGQAPSAWRAQQVA
ncbi:helix-turn-helix transcriptional regulator [Roseateles sp.]|uniref:helix-turn-helix transcriptional regulator n=1 Tax=Roseateles sp. TaxID=1971397 RepID=UPI0040368E2B